MSNLDIKITHNGLSKALKKAPDILVGNLTAALLRGVIELGRAGKRGAPKAHSTLANSMNHQRTAVLAYVVGPGVNYADMVAADTGAQGQPPFINIYDWVRVRRIKSRVPGVDQVDLAWLIAKSIKKKGTPESPFMDKPVEESKDRLHELVNDGVEKTLREAGLHG